MNAILILDRDMRRSEMTKFDTYKSGVMTMAWYSLNEDEIAKINAYFNEELSECRLSFGYIDGELVRDCVQVFSDDIESNFDSTVDEIASIINLDEVCSVVEA
jgi:hypothetical protein